MKILLFGASGMVGQGVLRECLLDPDVTEVAGVVRSRLSRSLDDLAPIESELSGFDAC